MVKVISMNEYIENYVASTALAMWKYRKFLINSRGFKKDYATDKAIDYGLKMLKAGIGSKEDLIKAESLFRDLSLAYSALADVCSEAIKEVPA